IQEGRACFCWGSATPSPLLLVLHVTPIGRVLPDKKGLQAIPLKSPCACRLSRRPPLTQVIELRLGLSKGSALQAEPLAMRSKALPFLSQVLRWSVTQGPQ